LSSGATTGNPAHERRGCAFARTGSTRRPTPGGGRERRCAIFDERRQVFLARVSVAKNEKPVWLALHDVLF
jgi:hypothetical protein